MREKRLTVMHNVVVGYADDYALNNWLSVVPDGETPEVFKEIAADDELYHEAWQVFSEIIKRDRAVALQYIAEIDKMIEEDYQI
jgi:hypothetical protein